MEKDCFISVFFAEPYEFKDSKENFYEDFNELPVISMLDYEESFFPVVNNISFKGEYNSTIVCEFNTNFNNTLNENKFGPSILSMPIIIDFEEED